MRKIKRLFIRIFNRFVLHSQIQIEVDSLKLQLQGIRNIQEVLIPPVLPIKDTSREILLNVIGKDLAYRDVDVSVSKMI